MANYRLLEDGATTPRFGINPVEPVQQLQDVVPTPVQPVLTTGGPLPPEVYTMNTGGNLPPVQMTTMNTGGNLPPLSEVYMNTGGNLPPLQATTTSAPPMSTPYPAVPAGTPPAGQMTGLSLPALNGQNYVATLGQGTGQQASVIDILNQINGAFNLGNRPDANGLVQQALSGVLDQNSPYIQRARQAALDQAATRGLMNSSIAQGAAEGAAIDRALPLVQEALGITNRRESENANASLAARAQAMGLLSDREQRAFQSQESALNRTQDVNNAILAAELNQRNMAYDYNFRNQLQNNQTLQQDWLNDRNFTRDFNATLSTLPIRGAYDLAQQIQQYALEDPETYTPQIISGMTNFFQQNMLSILQQYFPSLYGASNGGT